MPNPVTLRERERQKKGSSRLNGCLLKSKPFASNKRKWRNKNKNFLPTQLQFRKKERKREREKDGEVKPFV